MLTEVNNLYRHYYIDGQGRYQGEFAEWWQCGRLFRLAFFTDNVLHGEYMSWQIDGKLSFHGFYIHGKKVSFDELPYPKTEEDHMYFKLKYDLPLLTDEMFTKNQGRTHNPR